MLGVTLACASLLLAVGGVGVASMPPVRNVALPSIASVYADGTYVTGIRPVDASTNVSIDTTSQFLDVSIAGSTLHITDGQDEGENYVYILNYTAGDGLSFEDASVLSSYLPLYSNVPVVAFSSILDPGGYTLPLPDLTYWNFDGHSTYYLGVTFNHDDDDYGYYGLVTAVVSSGLTLSPVLPADLGADVNPISAIGDGLGVIPALGGGLTDGFDAVFVDNGALTAVGTFAFLLMGIGISVGIVKKCFNWVTGRHGM